MKKEFDSQPRSLITTTSVSSLMSRSLAAGSLMATSLIASGLVLIGCQSTPLNTANTINSNNTSIAAKTALSTALQKQRRSSFSYHSNIKISNDQQFTNIDPKSLVVSNSVDNYCEQTHDNAYATLVKEAETASKELSSIDYDAQRNTLKQSYLACDSAYRAWDNNRYYDPSEEEYRNTISPYYQQLFDNLDNAEAEGQLTPLDIKKAQLLDAYLLKPLSINAQGVYQPLAGKITMLMSAQYYARNHHTSINQPIYVDLKDGNIYLWADNFALLTSEFADDKLGTKWQDKWLKLAIDDGSLPKGFGKAVVKAHMEALDRTYETAPSSQFSYIAPTSLNALSPKLPEQQLKSMLQTKQVIRRVQSSENYEQAFKDYVSIFYERLTNQYPELIVEESSDYQTDSFPNEDELTSKFLVQQILKVMKNITDRQSDEIISEVYSNEQTTSIDNEDSESSIQTLYGIAQNGQIQWQHLRNHDSSSQPSTTKTKVAAQKGVTIDVLQQYTAVSSGLPFPNLPDTLQTPNASNSVDLRAYSRELMDYYRQGNGTTMGRLLFGSLPINRSEDDTEYDITDASMDEDSTDETSIDEDSTTEDDYQDGEP